MASNYEVICEENRQRYGTDIGRIGPMLLADRYDDRTHFIFELLQNAEDALGRRGTWNGLRRVTFDLSPATLNLSHFGRPFDEADVRGVCGIAESTKDKFSIGRFGIGFKSVYTFTDRPEIHSGEEDFAVENYVQHGLRWPVNADSEWPDYADSRHHCHATTGPSGVEGLGIRRWTCSHCGTEHDRDVNAARNILARGLAELETQFAAAREAKAGEGAVNEAGATARAGAGHGPLAAGIPVL